MTIPDTAGKREPGIYVARNLASLGVPIFLCKLDDEGNPDGRTAKGWLDTEPGEQSVRNIDHWQPGWALGAVCGHVFDVIDVDPRNGGLDSWPLLLARLADEPPELFGIAATPSRGAHFWIASQEVAKTRLAKGIDLQATGGFVFIAPTVRPSKWPADNGELRPYTWVMPADGNASPWLQEPRQAFAELPWSLGQDGPQPAAKGTGRRSPRELMDAVLAAEIGWQRPALLDLVREYEYQGLTPEAIRVRMRKFLLRVPNFNPGWLWIPGSNPDRHINGLIDTYRDGRYWIKGRPLVPDATADEMDGLREAAPNIVDPAEEEEAFWTSREDLTTIRQWAQAQMVSPWAVLAEIIAEVSVRVPPTFVLPRIIAGYSNLNMLFAVTGLSSSGKGGAAAVAADALSIDEPEINFMKPERHGVGSGEGLAKRYGYRKQGEVVRHTYACILEAPEIDTLKAMMDRGSETLSGELRKLWSGEQLGFGYGDPSKDVPIHRYSYRGVVIAGVQMERSGVIINNTGSGFSQRWILINAEDLCPPSDIEPERPDQVKWSMPRALEGLDHHTEKPLEVMEVCDTAVEEIKAARRLAVRGKGDPMKGHLLHNQEKFAAGLAILAMRTEITEEDWRLAGYAMKLSERLRAECRKALTRQKYAAARETGKIKGIEKVAAREGKFQEQERKSWSTILKYIPVDGRISYGKLVNKVPHLRKELKVILAKMGTARLITAEKGEYQGQPAIWYSQTK